jgi:hypothetical protein
MTEEDWLTCPDPEPMLRLLMQYKASSRKLRLFAIACARRVWAPSATDRELEVLDLALLMADGRAPDQDLWMTRSRVYDHPIAGLLSWATNVADEVSLAAASARGRSVRSRAFLAERVAQTELLREVFGNPLRPVVIEPAWLEWHQYLIRDLARGIYEDRTFQRLPILADALEDADCAEQALLDHLRAPGPHFRGCWAVDPLIGLS